MIPPLVPRPARRPQGFGGAVAAFGSAGLHAAAILLAVAARPDTRTVVEPPGLEIELVEQAPQAAAAEGDAASANTPSDTVPAPRSGEPVRAGAGSVPMPAAYDPASVPMPRRPPAAPAAPAPVPTRVSLGDASRDQQGMTVEGRDVVPPRPDAQHRNLPPAWPAALARRNVGGRLTLLLHVGPDGRVRGVDLVRGSGQPELDRAALDAARRWRFTPARRDGVAMPFDWPYTISFVTDSG